MFGATTTIATTTAVANGTAIDIPVGAVIAGRYEVVAFIDSGHFSRVYQARDLTMQQTGEATAFTDVAVKILHKGYETDADFERDILRAVTRNDPKDNYGVVKFRGNVKHEGCSGFVLPLKGISLQSVLSQPELRMGINLPQFMKDMGRALNFLHNTVRVVHTDIKPANIVRHVEFVGGTPPTAAANASGPVRREWDLCDLGSASFSKADALGSDVIGTRAYRAPECLLSIGWSFAADIWSVGCILFELITGEQFVSASNDENHLLALAERVEGSVFLARHTSQPSDDSPPMKRRIGTPRPESVFPSGPTADSERPTMTNLVLQALKGRRDSKVVGGDDIDAEYEAALMDLLSSMLEPDASRRITAKQLVSHPFAALSGQHTPTPIVIEKLQRLPRHVAIDTKAKPPRTTSPPPSCTPPMSPGVPLHMMSLKSASPSPIPEPDQLPAAAAVTEDTRSR